MQNVVNFNGGNGISRQRGEQDAAQAVAKRRAVAALQRLHDEFAIGPVRLQIGRFDSGLFNFNHSKPSLLNSGGRPAVLRSSKKQPRQAALFGVELNDKMLFHGNSNLIALRKVDDFRLQVFPVKVQPLWNRAGSVCFNRRLDLLAVTAGLLNRNHITRAQKIGRDVDLFAIDLKMAMVHELTAFRTRRGPAQQVNNIIEPALADAQQVFARYALTTLRHLEIFTELALLNAVVTAGLLLGTQLEAIFGSFLPALAVLARRIGTALHGALVRVAALALKEQLFCPRGGTACKPDRYILT